MSQTKHSEVQFDAAKLIDEHQLGVWRYCRALGCEPSEADDMTQETFLRVLEKPFEDHNHTATAAYLRKVAYSRFISLRKRDGRYVDLAQIEEVQKQWERWVDEDQGQRAIDALRDCLATLSQRARIALDLRFKEKKSRSTIALELEISENGAKNLMQRAKQQLRQCIDMKLQ